LRNVLRTPRRSALTLLGVAAAIATLVTIIGMLDTFRATLGSASAELLRTAPARVTVSLDSYYPVTGPVTGAVRRLPAAGEVQAGPPGPRGRRAPGPSGGVAAAGAPPRGAPAPAPPPARAAWCCPPRPPPPWGGARAPWSPPPTPGPPLAGW